MISKEKFIKMMETKLTYGDTISNEDIMRGLIILLADDGNIGKTEDTIKHEEFDAQAIARAFYNAHKTDSSYRVKEAAQTLKSEMTYIQYTDVISEISQLDGNSFFIGEMVSAMSRVI